ncbi:MAG: hypothetical protein AB1592_14220 [Pseudomonadota bacterium]
MSRLGVSVPSTALLRGRAQTQPPPTQATALIARMTAAPSTARATAIGALVRSLASAGLWQKLDALYLLAAHDAQAARLNWVPWTGTVTNQIKNNAMQGAAPGLRPTGWRAPYTNVAGLMFSVAGVGSEGGIDYTDWDISGTPSSAGTAFLYCYGSETDIVASAGQTWSGSAFVRLVSGSLAGTTWTGGVNGLFLFAYDAAVQVTNGPATGFTPTTGALASARILNEKWTTPANTATLGLCLRFQVASGVPVAFRIRIGWPQLVRMDVAGDPIRTTGAAASQTQTLNRFDLQAVNSPAFLADRGYAGASGSYLSTNYNPATDGVHYTRNSGHVGAWDLAERAPLNVMPVGTSTTTGLQIGIYQHYSTGLCWIAANDAGGATASIGSSGFFVGSRLSAAARQAYRNGGLLADTAIASIAVPSVPVDLLCFSGSAGRSHWCTDRIAAFSMGAGLGAGEVATFHQALQDYLRSVGAVT